ncbi:hypothetical protein [Streptomyces sp. NRRL F-5135]|uniref:hypothetical protein n=1 Tax=Streptomyces sp. NRRL F-5135 TaxID=1463858 RepID=UPI0004CA7657|nr:hypothetical protein [Streptomyces sp. NRRL F-5135]
MARYDQLASRVYTETRMPSGTRDLVLALGWVTLRDPRRHDPAIGTWARTREVMNTDNKRIWQLIAEDVPRYDFDLHDKAPMGCQAPMVRVQRLCGRNTMYGFSEFDPATGWMTYWGFCNRPRCREYMRTIEQRAKGSKDRAPEPIPNAGGLLPLFFSWNWEAKYRKAMALIKFRSSWEPPSYGLSADEWPEVPGQEKPKAFPKLRLIASGGEVIQRARPKLVIA